ncbi:MAG: DUF3102 domain-containing protein [Mesorhizobium sp.]|uniref:hypothetical protein n=1 Tax=Mesorhizobium sp. TaxID=1871066 RepID=UPI0012005F4C|nr:hypothetical protein [Mesorhizobium sp.]TIL94514.1 MAG: DUF3102 domain-containing protein [Mesorhizobium sp.]
MIDPRVKALCDEFDVEIVDRHAYPEPGQTRAVVTIRRIIDRHGEAHARMVLCILAEGRGNQALIDEVSLWAISDLVLACADLVEADATGFLEMFDKMPLGPLMAIANELRSIVPQRHALAGMLYLQARRMRESLTGRQAGPAAVRRANESEVEKGRPLFKHGARLSAAEKLALGRELLAKKGELPWGHFGPWLREQSGLSEQTAHRYMRAARAAG